MAVNKSVEMRLSERYHATRRNYLFSVTLLLVLTVAAPATIHIPGFGNEAKLASALGYVGLWLAAVMFGYDFYVEHALSKIRNSDALVAVEDEDIVRGLRARVEALSGLTSSIDKFSHEFDGAIAELKRSESIDTRPDVDELVAKIRPALDQPMGFLGTITPIPTGSDALQSRSSFAAYVKKFEKPFAEILRKELSAPYANALQKHADQRTMLVQAMSKVHAELPHLKDAIEEDGRLLDRLTGEFKRVGAAVHRTQRIAFKIKDTWLSWILFGAATIAMLWRVLPQIPLPRITG